MKKFTVGLVTALILGAAVNIILGYVRFGYFQHPEKILGGLLKIFSARGENKGKPIDKDLKNCRDLVPNATAFGKLKVIVTGNGKPSNKIPTLKGWGFYSYVMICSAF